MHVRWPTGRVEIQPMSVRLHGGLSPQFVGGKLHYVDAQGRKVSVQVPGRNAASWELSDEPVGCAVADNGSVLVGCLEGLWLLDPVKETDNLTLLVSPPFSGHRLNGMGVDPRGRLWVTTTVNGACPDEAGLYRFDPESRQFIGLGPKLPWAGSPAWSPDGTSMFLVEAQERVLWRLGFDPQAGEVSASEEITRFSMSATWRPGGLVVAANGDLLVTKDGDHSILLLPSEGGYREITALYLPDVPRPTAVCLGDTGEMFVTTARQGDHIVSSVFERDGEVMRLSGPGIVWAAQPPSLVKF